MTTYTAQISVIDPNTNNTIFSTNVATNDNADVMTGEFFKSGLIDMAQYYVDRIIRDYGILVVNISNPDLPDGTGMTPVKYIAKFNHNVIHWYVSHDTPLVVAISKPLNYPDKQDLLVKSLLSADNAIKIKTERRTVTRR